MAGPKKARFLAKNQYAQRKPLYFENTGSTSLSKIRHDFRKKIEVRKNVFFYKKMSPKLIFLNDFS